MSKNDELYNRFESRGYKVKKYSHCIVVNGIILYYGGESIDGKPFYIVQREKNDWKAETLSEEQIDRLT